MDKNSFSVCHWTQAFFSWWSPISYFVCKQDVVLGWFLRHPCTIQIPDHSGTGNLVQMITVLQTIGNLHRCFWAVFKAHSWRILSGCDWFCFHISPFPPFIPICAGSRARRLQQSPTWAKEKETSAKSRWTEQRHSEGDGSKVCQTSPMTNEIGSVI